MDEDEVDALLGLFATKITDQYEVLDCSSRQGIIVIRQGDTVHRLHFDHEVLAQNLDADEPAFWDASRTSKPGSLTSNGTDRA